MPDPRDERHPRAHPDLSYVIGQLLASSTDETCDRCGSTDTWWRNCKLLCRSCAQIVKSCADL